MANDSNVRWAASAAFLCATLIKRLINSGRPVKRSDSTERNPTQVARAIATVAPALNEAFAELDRYYKQARAELLEVRHQQVSKGVPTRPSPVSALGITRVYALDIAHETIREAVSDINMVVNEPRLSPLNDAAVFLSLVDALPDVNSTEWRDFFSLLEVEVRDTTAALAGDGKAKAKRRGRRNRQPLDPKALTDKQAEAVQIVGECKGDIAEAARRLGKDRATVEQHYRAAMNKLGKTVVKHATTQLPSDRRGGTDLSDIDDSRQDCDVDEETDQQRRQYRLSRANRRR